MALSEARACGELWVRSPCVMSGYLGDTALTSTAIVFDEGGVEWLRTGDVAYRDEHGIFYIVDRLKDLIKVAGIGVAPAELEACIAQHAAVRDV